MRGLNVGENTNQVAHDAPWFGARGSNTGPDLAIPGGSPLGHSCYGSVSRKNWPYIYGLNTKSVKIHSPSFAVLDRFPSGSISINLEFQLFDETLKSSYRTEKGRVKETFYLKNQKP